MATERERQAVRLLQTRIDRLGLKIQQAAEWWPLISRKTVVAWTVELADITNQFNYTIHHLMVDEAARVRVFTHDCHDQYCYQDDRHACHQEGCTH